MFGTGVVDQVAVGGVSGEEGSQRQVVERAGQAVGGLVEACDGVVGEQRLGATGEGQVVLQIEGGLGQVHGRQGVAGEDALVEAGEVTHAEAVSEDGLADQSSVR